MTQFNGPVLLDLIGTRLSQEEKDILQHPSVGGVVLFTRNYESPEQITELCKEIRLTRKSPLLITVDHEGGRVQRFRQGFTSLPAMGKIGELYVNDPQTAGYLAETCGLIMATELLAIGVDLSFAPVVDLNKKRNNVIGDRAFHSDPMIVTKLAKLLIKGMSAAGMATTIKHFPGHGSVDLDSHIDMPVDKRKWEDILSEDMQPFIQLIQSGVQAVMPAHIVFTDVDDKPVGFSHKWLYDILRRQIQFTGVIFSDDLNMEGAKFAGDYVNRAKTALDAGCDMILICNNRRGALQILDQLPQTYFVRDERFKLLQGRFNKDYKLLCQDSSWKNQVSKLTAIIESVG